MLGQVFTSSTSSMDNANLLLAMKKLLGIQASCHQLLWLFSFWLCLAHRTHRLEKNFKIIKSNPSLLLASQLSLFNVCHKPFLLYAYSLLEIAEQRCYLLLILVPSLFSLLQDPSPSWDIHWRRMRNLLVTLGCSSLETFDVVLLVIFKSCFVFPQKYENWMSG